MKRKFVGHSPTREEVLRPRTQDRVLTCLEQEQLRERVQEQRALLNMRIEQEQLTLSQRLPFWRIDRVTQSAYHLDASMIIPATMQDRDPTILLAEVHGLSLNFMEKQFHLFGSMKLQLIMKVTMIKPEKEIDFWAVTKKTALIDSTEITTWLERAYAVIAKRIEAHMCEGSGYSTGPVLELKLHIDRFRPIGGGSFLNTPIWLSSKKCTINIQNEDSLCFKYALLAACEDVPTKHPQRVSKYSDPKYEGRFNFSGTEFPVRPSDSVFKKFEQQNPLYSLDVFKLSTQSKTMEDLMPCYVSSKKNVTRLALILLWDPDSDKQHYIAVKHDRFDALVRIVNSSNQEACCRRCFHRYSGINAHQNLADHEPHCQGINGGGVQKIRLPEPGSILKFNKPQLKIPCPIAILFDFEAFAVPIDQKVSDSTTFINRQEASGVCALVIGPDNLPLPGLSFFSHPGTNPAAEFLKHLDEIAPKLKAKLQAVPKCPRLSKQELECYRQSEVCWICEEGGFTDYDQSKGPRDQLSTMKVKDHCHASGKFRGAAHRGCNLQAREYYTIPVLAHNLGHYDGHLLFLELAESQHSLFVIAKNPEDYVGFSIQKPPEVLMEGGVPVLDAEGNHKLIPSCKFKFLDSCNFLNASLDELVKNLPPEAFVHTERLALSLDIPLKMLTRKGVFPYSYMDSPDRLAEMSLPPLECFYNGLKLEACKLEDYEFAQEMWMVGRCKTLWDFQEIYLRTDVALLADVVQSFRSATIAEYGVDPLHCWSLPGVSWQSLLKSTRVELDLITDPDMYIAFETGRRGGLCQVSHRLLEANNPTVEGYDSTKDTVYLRYDDRNNLYGEAMCQGLPIGGYQWNDPSEWTLERISSLPPDGDLGAVFLVDLHYPEALHDLHAALPLCPEPYTVKFCELSDFQKQLAGTYVPQAKLVANLHDKKEYWIHYRMLQFALQHGLQLVRIHKVITFRQEAWMKSYIDKNTAKRKLAKNEFQKSLPKLMNNSVFGKTMEDTRKHRDISILRPGTLQHERFIREPSYKGRRLIGSNMVIGERSKGTLMLDKPISVGFTVLELSKVFMYDFLIEKLSPAVEVLGGKVQVAYMDTDSFIYAVSLPPGQLLPADFFRGNSPDALFDTSNYPEDDLLFHDCNQAQLGYMKDEAAGKSIVKFVGLRAKMYAVDIVGKDTIKKSKGTSKPVVAKRLSMADYLSTLHSRVSKSNINCGFRTKGHEIKMQQQKKVSLSAFDTKRFILDDGISTLPFGHKCIKAIKLAGALRRIVLKYAFDNLSLQ